MVCFFVDFVVVFMYVVIFIVIRLVFVYMKVCIDVVVVINGGVFRRVVVEDICLVVVAFWNSFMVVVINVTV